MRDHGLPILDELRDDLASAFGGAESQPRRPRRRLALIGAGGLAAAAVAAVVLALGTDVEKASVRPSAAAAALLDVAEVAAKTAAPVPRDDQFYFVRSEGSNLSMYAGVDPKHTNTPLLVTSERRIWLSVSRQGQLEQAEVSSRPLTSRDVERHYLPPELIGTGGRPQPLSAMHHYNLGGSQLTRQQLLDYPTDPQEIHDRLLRETRGQGNSPEGEVFTVIGDALREAPAPPEVRAAFYRALALIPGIELVGPVTDRKGRKGLAVAFTEVGIRQELVFDPETSELLAERQVLADPAKAGIDAPAGSVIGDTVYLQRAVTDELTAPK